MFPDPLTASLNVAYAIIILATKVFDATPPEDQRKAAGDLAKLNHNIAEFVLSVQAKINQGVK